MAKAARRLGRDPWAYRDGLALRSGDTTATGQRLDTSVGTDDVIRAIREAAGPPPKPDGVNAWGAPKPRNAPCGGWLVATARPRTRTTSQR